MLIRVDLFSSWLLLSMFKKKPKPYDSDFSGEVPKIYSYRGPEAFYPSASAAFKISLSNHNHYQLHNCLLAMFA